MKSKRIVVIILVITFISTLFSNNYSAAQDLQGLQSSSPSPSSGPGMSINNSIISDNNSTLLDRVTIGSFGDDRITGSNSTDIIIGLLGADTIRASGGDDKIQGNEDVDKLYGEGGNDLLQGGAATDQLYGGQGNDVLSGGMGDNFLAGEVGNDKLYGGAEDDILQGGDGADYFDCGEGVDIIIDFNAEEGDDNAGNCEEIPPG